MGEKHIGHLLPWLTFSLVAVFMHVKLVLTFKNYNYERNEQFTISGFVVNNAEVHNFEKSSIARFGISYRTSVKKDDQEIKLSAILNIETWIKNDDTATLDLLQKGKLIKVEGFFKADTYTKDGKDFHVTKMTATKIELVQKTAKEA